MGFHSARDVQIERFDPLHGGCEEEMTHKPAEQKNKTKPKEKKKNPDNLCGEITKGNKKAGVQKHVVAPWIHICQSD